MGGLAYSFGKPFSQQKFPDLVQWVQEAEIKHARVAMLAALGFPVAEQFHPLFGGNIDVPSYIAFQETPLQTFWPAVVLLIAIPEVFSVFTFQSPFGGETWSIRTDYEPGDLGFDPLGLKPTSAAELKEMQTKELNNGRLANRDRRHGGAGGHHRRQALLSAGRVPEGCAARVPR